MPMDKRTHFMEMVKSASQKKIGSIILENSRALSRKLTVPM